MRERLWTKHYVNSCDTDRTLFPPPLEAKKQKIKKSNFFLKKKKNFSAFFCSPFLSVIAMQDEIVVNNEESRIFYEEILCLVQ